jgi:ABC-2 type transport system ATP-binding protein
VTGDRAAPSLGLRLEIQNLHKSYGEVRALSGVDLEARGGEIVALLGPNGAGKTTLVSIVAGLRRPDAGGVRVNGVDVATNARAARVHLGLAPQQTGVYPTVSVRDNLRFFGEMAGLRRRELRRKVADIAEAFGLVDLLPRQALTLSGGESRRLHTAMAVLHRPSLLLLDEPTVGADVQTRNKLLEVVRSLAEDGSTVCYSTHYLHEIEQVEARAVAILVKGKVAAAGSVGQLVRSHGGGCVELHFAEEAPRVRFADASAQREENVMRVTTDAEPARSVASLLGQLGDSASTLREIKLVQPSLESVFLAVTKGGKRG